MCNNKPIKIILITLIPISIWANSFEKNCLNCHFQQIQLQIFMSKYTLKYSSQEKIEKAIFDYIKNPSKETSVMPFGFLRRFGIKEETTLDDIELKKAINGYYKQYNLKQFIK